MTVYNVKILKKTHICRSIQASKEAIVISIGLLMSKKSEGTNKSIYKNEYATLFYFYSEPHNQ